MYIEITQKYTFVMYTPNNGRAEAFLVVTEDEKLNFKKEASVFFIVKIARRFSNTN